MLVSAMYFTMSLVYSVKRMQLKLPCGIPSLMHFFVDMTPCIWMAIVLSVIKLFIQRYTIMLLCKRDRQGGSIHDNDVP